jgi:hypothetical protein
MSIKEIQEVLLSILVPVQEQEQDTGEDIFPCLETHYGATLRFDR